MTDTNGRVAPEHLVTRFGVPVSRAIAPLVDATSLVFHRAGHTFSIALPYGGERPYEIQAAMRSDYLAHHYKRFNLSPPPSPAPAPAGSSRHGFGLAIDVVTSASAAERHELMTECGWHLWSASDANHYEPNAFNVLVSPPAGAFASSGSTPIGSEDDMAGAGLYGLFSRTDGDVVTLAVGSLTPGYETHDNYWAEAPEAKRADWEAMFGPARNLRTDVWNVRSDDPKRISDLSKFPFIGAAGSASSPDVAALAKALVPLLPAGVTAAQLEAAAESAVRKVLGGLDGK